MSNKVENKITFCATEQRANKILKQVIVEKRHVVQDAYGCKIEKISREFDFNKLIPMPLHIYRGKFSQKEEADFGANNIWYHWSIDNWGCKLNALNTNLYYDETQNTQSIIFDTPWSIPHPVIIAFANKFQIEFEYAYLEECYEFFGIEKWKKENGVMVREKLDASKKDIQAIFGEEYDLEEE